MKSTQAMALEITKMRNSLIRTCLTALFSLALFALSTNCYGNNPLSDYSWFFQEKEGIDRLNDLATELILSAPDSALLITEQSIRLSTELSYENGLFAAYRNLALIKYNRGEFQESERYYLLNLEYRKRQNDPLALALAHYVLSRTTRRLGKRPETLENLLAALKLLDNSSDRPTLNKVNNALGTHYLGEGDFVKAEEHYKAALELRLEDNDSSGLAYSYHVIGNLYGRQGLVDKAKKSYLKGIEYLTNSKSPKRLASMLTNLGVTYYNNGIYDSAQIFYSKSLSVQKQIGDVYNQTLTLNNLTVLAYELKNYHKSIDYARQGVELAKETGASELLSSLYYNLSDSYKALGDYRRSFEYYKLSDSIDYEITNSEKNAQLAELQVKFDTEKKDREIAEKTLELTEASIEQKQLLMGLVFVLLVAGFIYWSLLRKKKSNKLLQSKKELIEKREQEKALLLRELHHRVKNNFQVVSSLLNLQYYEAESDTAAEAIKAGQTRVEAMSMIHRELYQGENDTALEMKDYVVHLIENAIYLYDFEPEAVGLDLDIDDSPLDVKYAIPLGIIINELVTNAFKHAFQSVDRPALSVYLNMDTASQKLTLKVGDNGPGLSHTGDVKSSSFGLELIGDLMKQLKGEMTIDNQSGSEFTIVFPYIPLSAHVEG